MDFWSGFDVFVYTVLGAGLLATALAMLALTLVGVLWSPFAAAICGLIARKRGLDPDGGYARAGFASSCSLFLPWIYLVSRMLGKPLPGDLVIVGYCALFLLWMFGACIPAIVLLWLFFGPYSDMFGPLGQYEWRDVITLIICTASSTFTVAMWSVTLRQMVRIFRRYRRGDASVPQSDTIAPVYLRPFKYAAITFAVTVVVNLCALAVILD